MSLSVVVPTLDEAPRLPTLLLHLAAVAPEAEVVVVDGGSSDGTQALAEEAGARLLRTCPGRAGQMNLGAAATSGDLLLFLHADTWLPPGASRLVADTLSDEGVAVGAFAFRFAEGGRRVRFVEAGARLRSRIRPTPYGDQGLFLRRSTFEALGGFAALPVLEDLDLVERARRLGRVVVRAEPATTSARRYLDRGPLRLMARHWWLSLRFLAGWRPAPDEVVPR